MPPVLEERGFVSEYMASDHICSLQVLGSVENNQTSCNCKLFGTDDLIITYTLNVIGKCYANAQVYDIVVAIFPVLQVLQRCQEM